MNKSAAAVPQGPGLTARQRSEAALVASASLDCVHCGLCLSSCPTYMLNGREPSSPRGRIYLMRAISEGRLAVDETSCRDLDECLVCRNCETVCPAGVRFGEMMEHTRDLLEQSPSRRPGLRRLKRAAFRWLLPRARLLGFSATLLGLSQHPRLAGLRRLALRWLPASLAAAEKQLPRIPSRRDRRRLPRESKPERASRARVGLLEGCVAAQLLPQTNQATCRVLNRHDATVVCPPSRPCCGALALHFGDSRSATRQAIATIKAFDRAKVDAVVVNSAGCGSAMKDYGRLLAGTRHAARALAFAGRVVDISEYLVRVGIEHPRGKLALRVAYDDPCHLLHAQRVAQPPRQMLEAIPGMTLVPHDGAETCCGAAGIYNVLQPKLSQEILQPKIAALQRAAPDVVATGNPGCLLQIRAGLEQAGAAIEVVHPVELLDRAYRLGDAKPRASPPAPRGNPPATRP